MSTQTRACHNCGKPVSRSLPDDSTPFARLLRDLPYYCDECVTIAEQEASDRHAAEREEQDAKDRDERVRQSGLPPKYLGVSIDELDHPQEILGEVHQWALHGGGLLLAGGIGLGKTTLAGAAASRRLQTRSVIWTSAPLLFARLGSGLGTEQRNWALGLLADRTALVLDDIDKARPTQYGAEQVFLAVDQRVEHEAPLLITSNLSPAQLAERWPEPYGDAIASRLVGYCTVLRIDGDDRRLAR